MEKVIRLCVWRIFSALQPDIILSSKSFDNRDIRRISGHELLGLLEEDTIAPISEECGATIDALNNAECEKISPAGLVEVIMNTTVWREPFSKQALTGFREAKLRNDIYCGENCNQEFIALFDAITKYCSPLREPQSATAISTIARVLRKKRQLICASEPTTVSIINNTCKKDAIDRVATDLQAFPSHFRKLKEFLQLTALTQVPKEVSGLPITPQYQSAFPFLANCYGTGEFADRIVEMTQSLPLDLFCNKCERLEIKDDLEFSRSILRSARHLIPLRLQPNDVRHKTVQALFGNSGFVAQLLTDCAKQKEALLDRVCTPVKENIVEV